MNIEETRKPTVLIVDDTPTNLTLLAGLLKDQYRIKVANSGKKAIELAAASPPDLILLDIMMPAMDGYEVCRRLQADEITRRVPVIFLTAKTSTEDEELGFSVGAVDFIHKPISPPIVIARVRTHLRIKAWQDFLQDKNLWLEKEITQRLSDINRLQDASIYVMVSLAEFRDECTGNHIRRTQEYVRILAKRLAELPRFASVLTDAKIELLAKSATLHDIGKITIPDHILLKPGKHTDEEFTVMKTHAQRGYDMLRQAGDLMGEHGAFLHHAMDIALYHHEKWDGSGYPNGLAGNMIPLEARLMAIADVYDALCSRRPYKAAIPHDDAVNIILQGNGTHFDPYLVDVFCAVAKDFINVAINWPD
ncbi:HD domain-containing phosphohydrolase [Acinetobacter sp.]|uniref:HD domain-containing phosphohydrolase n=1 Tax=Acinetobacter sp. TaxID=472 RepID=UPI003CFBCFBA